jgi:hypothetical protein
MRHRHFPRTRTPRSTRGTACLLGRLLGAEPLEGLPATVERQTERDIEDRTILERYQLARLEDFLIGLLQPEHAIKVLDGAIVEPLTSGVRRPGEEKRDANRNPGRGRELRLNASTSDRERMTCSPATEHPAVLSQPQLRDDVDAVGVDEASEVPIADLLTFPFEIDAGYHPDFGEV